MIDERDIRQEKAYYYEQRARMVIENLKKRRMEGQYLATSQEALAAVMAMIPPGVVVARGDSITLDQIGFVSEIKKRQQNKVLDPFEIGPDGAWADREEMQQMMRESFLADILVSGTNAITLDGKLVNIDGNGNRVAATVFGPRKVILVVGVNKIVKDVNEALERIHQYAAPVNAYRHYIKHHMSDALDLPCVRTGSCVDCKSEWKVCNYTMIIEGAMPHNKGRIHVVLVGEELGI